MWANLFRKDTFFPKGLQTPGPGIAGEGEHFFFNVPEIGVALAPSSKKFFLDGQVEDSRRQQFLALSFMDFCEATNFTKP